MGSRSLTAGFAFGLFNLGGMAECATRHKHTPGAAKQDDCTLPLGVDSRGGLRAPRSRRRRGKSGEGSSTCAQQKACDARTPRHAAPLGNEGAPATRTARNNLTPKAQGGGAWCAHDMWRPLSGSQRIYIYFARFFVNEVNARGLILRGWSGQCLGPPSGCVLTSFFFDLLFTRSAGT